MNKKLSFNHNYPYYQDFLMKQILLNFVMNSNGNEIHKIFVIDNLLHEYKSNKANLMSTIFFISAYLFGVNGDKHIIEEYSDLSNSKSDFNVSTKFFIFYVFKIITYIQKNITHLIENQIMKRCFQN